MVNSLMTAKFAVPSPKRAPDAPPVGLQKIGRRGKHVGNAVPEIDVPVAVIIDAISRTMMARTGSGSWRQAIDTRGDGHRGRCSHKFPPPDLTLGARMLHRPNARVKRRTIGSNSAAGLGWGRIGA